MGHFFDAPCTFPFNNTSILRDLYNLRNEDIKCSIIQPCLIQISTKRVFFRMMIKLEGMVLMRESRWLRKGGQMTVGGVQGGSYQTSIAVMLPAIRDHFARASTSEIAGNLKSTIMLKHQYQNFATILVIVMRRNLLRKLKATIRANDLFFSSSTIRPKPADVAFSLCWARLCFNEGNLWKFTFFFPGGGFSFVGFDFLDNLSFQYSSA